MEQEKKLTINEEDKQIFAEWCMQYTEKMINESISPIIIELLTDKAFMTLLRKWKSEKNWYEKIRKGDIYNHITCKIDLPNISKNQPLKLYQNEVFNYNHTLMTIVMNWVKD